MQQLAIDRTTAKRIRGYYNYRWTRHRDHAGDAFVKELPYQLRTRTSCMVHEAMIRTCPLFATSERIKASNFICAPSTTPWKPAGRLSPVRSASTAISQIDMDRVNVCC